LDKTIIYYTDNTFPHDQILRNRIFKSARGIPVISVSFYPISFGRNIVVGDIGRSHESIYKQILIALRAAPDGMICMTMFIIIHISSSYRRRTSGRTSFTITGTGGG
jgi:hypothetical protein